MRATMIVIVLKLLFIKENVWRKRKKLVEKTVKDEF